MWQAVWQFKTELKISVLQWLIRHWRVLINYSFHSKQNGLASWDICQEMQEIFHTISRPIMRLPPPQLCSASWNALLRSDPICGGCGRGDNPIIYCLSWEERGRARRYVLSDLVISCYRNHHFILTHLGSHFYLFAVSCRFAKGGCK